MHHCTLAYMEEIDGGDVAAFSDDFHINFDVKF